MKKLLLLQNRIFGTRLFPLKAALAILLMVVACLTTLGMLTYLGMTDTSRYEIKDLKVTQKGIGLNMSWQEQDCAGYEIFILRNKKRPRSVIVDTNSCWIELDELNEKYHVVVTAKSKGGGASGASGKTIYVRKVKQPIETAKKDFAGFEGNRMSMGAKAPEKLTFRSSDEKVVKVSQKGVMDYGVPGKARIDLFAEEGPQYKKGRTSVSVTVYPERLGKPSVEVSKTENFDAILSWTPVEFTQKYQVLKKNPATGDFNVVAETDGNTTTVKVPREHAEYSILPTAEVEKQHVEGEPSKTVTVKSAAEVAKSYSSYKNLRTLDHSTLDVVATVKGVESASVPQSMSYVDGNYVISYSSHSGNQGAMVCYDPDGNRVADRSVVGMGHANGSTYNPNTGNIYTVKTHKKIKSRSCSTYDGKDFSSTGEFNLPKNTSGIAYDTSTNKYYLSKGNELYVTDSDFNLEHYYGKKIRYNHAQDIGAYDGVALVCTWVSGNTSYIDMYRMSDGAYIGGYSVPIGEIESVLVVDHHLVLLMNNVDGTNTDQIMMTKDPVVLP